MEKKEIEKLYNELGDSKIDDLYMYSCLLGSGYNKEKAYNRISLLTDLYIKDEYGYSIGKLSDMLYYVDNNYNIQGMRPRELLCFIDMHGYEMYEDEEDE